MSRIVFIALVIAVLFLLMLPMHLRSGRFHWVPPKNARETGIEQAHRTAHRRLSEGFQGDASSSQAPLTEESPLLEFAPDTPAPIERQDQPFHLLSDWFPAGNHAAMGAEACYQADYEQKHNCVGNLAQTTNNYKRDYPDHCSGAPQDIVMGFYGRS